MHRTQIQLPDSLYQQSCKVAGMLEMSPAELTRRALEQFTSQYRNKLETGWQMPKPKNCGKMLSDPALLDPAEVILAEEKFLGKI